MKHWKRTLVVVAASPLALAGLGVNPAVAVSSTCSEFTVPMTRLVNPTTGSSLLSQYSVELNDAKKYGFTTSDGVALKASRAGGTGLVAVWRAYNSTTRDFTWAAEGSDLNQLKAKGYKAQFRQFYAATTGNGCLASGYRMSNGTKTRIAVGTTDRDKLAASGWKTASSGIFYAVAGTTTSSAASTATQSVASAAQVSGSSSSDDFTIAVIPDTQQETWTDSDTRFKNRSTWLVNNASRLNLKFTTHVGDVVDWGNVAPAQYTRAKNGLSPLNGKIPYSLTVGNHDTAAVCAGGSACPGANASVTVRDTTAFNNAFTESYFTNMKGQFEAGKVDNSYSTFSAAGQKWMVLNLELWARPAAIAWAKKVVAANLDYNVIVATHSYMDSSGTIGTSNGGYGSTSPKYLFDNLIKVYPNIKMVLSGHVGTAATRTDTGVNGNKIVSFLQCYHSRTTNPVRLVTISVAKGSVTDSVYAPYTNQTLSGSTTRTGLDFTR
ncbi:MAG: metallophosphoesterase [Micropruina sp.]|uniref:metallophosphoesterase n=1 Tax=Micropruina sp. TaxID=2737536 RepID=UPI0039E4F4E0